MQLLKSNNNETKNRHQKRSKSFGDIKEEENDYFQEEDEAETLAIVFYLPSRIRFLFISRGTIPPC